MMAIYGLKLQSLWIEKYTDVGFIEIHITKMLVRTSHHAEKATCASFCIMNKN